MTELETREVLSLALGHPVEGFWVWLQCLSSGRYSAYSKIFHIVECFFSRPYCVSNGAACFEGRRAGAWRTFWVRIHATKWFPMDFGTVTLLPGLECVTIGKHICINRGEEVACFFLIGINLPPFLPRRRPIAPCRVEHPFARDWWHCWRSTLRRIPCSLHELLEAQRSMWQHYRVTELNMTRIWIDRAGRLTFGCRAEFSLSELRFMLSSGILRQLQIGDITCELQRNFFLIVICSVVIYNVICYTWLLL